MEVEPPCQAQYYGSELLAFKVYSMTRRS